MEKYDYKVTRMVGMDAFKAVEDRVGGGGNLGGKGFKKVICEQVDTMKEHR